jgi:hypothetical protein
MPDIIDVSFTCGSQAGFLSGAGVKTVIRYYSRDTGIPEKRLSPSEARAFAAAGLRLAIVHEAKYGDQIASFTESLGESDSAYARQYGSGVINQPQGSAIYFGVDIDATGEQIQTHVIPYFRGVATAMAAGKGLPVYEVGIYGSGASCEAILNTGLARFAWLAQSKGWQDYKPFLQSNKWSLLQGMPTKVGEIECDPDRSNGDFGDFLLAAAIASVVANQAPPISVIARSGLRLRAGPGTNFDVMQTLPLGSQVYPIKSAGDWTMVSLSGDNAGDGFVSSHFLSA